MTHLKEGNAAVPRWNKTTYLNSLMQLASRGTPAIWSHFTWVWSFLLWQYWCWWYYLYDAINMASAYALISSGCWIGRQIVSAEVSASIVTYSVDPPCSTAWNVGWLVNIWVVNGWPDNYTAIYSLVVLIIIWILLLMSLISSLDDSVDTDDTVNSSWARMCWP